MTDCPDPANCPVTSYPRVAAAPDCVIGTDTVWARCYDGTFGYDEPNPGKGGPTRFAPFVDAGSAVPTMYLASNVTGALLETVFHELIADEDAGEQYVYEMQLRKRLLSYLQPPQNLMLVDLRDPSLAELGVPRSAIVASPAEHSFCTIGIAAAFYRARTGVHGLIWHSRQAELQRAAGVKVEPSEVAIVFSDRVTRRRDAWPRAELMTVSLASGYGRTLVDEVVDRIGITLITG